MRKIIFAAMIAILLATSAFAQAPPPFMGAPPPFESGGQGGGATADTQPPAIIISSPTTDASHSTTSPQIAIRGSASDIVGVASISYLLSGATTGSGTASGTTSWSFSATLQQGTTTITVTARDAAGNIATDTIVITYSPPVAGACNGDVNGKILASLPADSQLCSAGTPADIDRAGTTLRWSWKCQSTSGGTTASCSVSRDSTRPSIDIKIPKSSGTFPTHDESLSISGTASDSETGVVSITYVLSDPASGAVLKEGVATGTLAWRFQENFRLGITRIAVTARDAAGNFRIRPLDIDRTPEGQALPPLTEEKKPTCRWECDLEWGTCSAAGKQTKTCEIVDEDCEGGTPPSLSQTERPCIPATSGTCGSAGGKTRTTAPSGGLLCYPGSASDVSPTDEGWSWTCTGTDLNTVPCSATRSAAQTVATTNKCANVVCPPTRCADVRGERYYGSKANTCDPETDENKDGKGDCTRLHPEVCVKVDIARPSLESAGALPKKIASSSGNSGLFNYVTAGDKISITSFDASDPDRDPIKLICGTTAGGNDVCDSAISDLNYVFNDPICDADKAYAVQWNDDTQHDIYCFVQDSPADGSAPKRSQPVIISMTSDNTAPSISVNAPVQWQNTDALPAVSCNDAGSGCDMSSLKLKIYSEQPPSCPQTYSGYDTPSPASVPAHSWACAAAKDNVGKARFTTTVQEIKVDKAKPLTSILCNDEECIDTYKAEIMEFSLSAADSGGSAPKETRYRINGGEEQLYNNEPVVISSHGHYTIEYWSVDNAGNQEDRKSTSVFLNRNAVTQNLAVSIEFIKAENGAEKSVSSIKIGTPKENFFARARCRAVDKATGETVENCYEGKTRVMSFDITTKLGAVNYIQRESWAQNSHWNDAKKAWEFPIDTTFYQSSAKGCADHDGVQGCGSNEYWPVSATMALDISYPDVQNFIVPTTATGAPNFTRSMPILFSAVPTITDDTGSVPCGPGDCTMNYSIDGGEEFIAPWDDFVNAFSAAPPSAAMPCDQYHTLRAKAKKISDPDLGLENDLTKSFFVSCVPRVTVSPSERRFVTGETNKLAFNVTIWNPMDAQNFELSMISAEPAKQFVLEWLSMICASPEACKASDDSAVLSLDAVGSRSVFVDMAVAGKSGIFPVKFTATAGGKSYEGRGTLQIFAEGLPEFSLWQLAVAAMMLTIFVWRNPEVISPRKRK